MIKSCRIWMIFYDCHMIKVNGNFSLDIFILLFVDYSGDDVNVRAIVSSLQEKTRLNSKSKNMLPTRMLKKTKQIKHVRLSSPVNGVDDSSVFDIAWIDNVTCNSRF